MGYFDALTNGSFKRIEGQWCFYPWGALGRGYLIPSEQRYLEIRSWVKRTLQVWLPVVIATGILAGWVWSFMLLPVFGAWYVVKVRAIAKGLQTTTERLTVRESYRAQASGHSLWTLWALGVSSIVFVVAGIAILVLQPGEWLLAGATVGFFGMCAVVIRFMIGTRMKGSDRVEGGPSNKPLQPTSGAGGAG